MKKKEIIASWRKFRILSSNSFVKNLSKQILRLERENEKLKDKNKALEMYADLADEKIDGLKKKLKEELKTIADKDLSFVARFDSLEKENKELKDDNKVMADNYSKMEQKFYDNLSKAKAIIKDLMNNSDEYAKQRASDFLEEK